jgi:hypothetical protein
MQFAFLLGENQHRFNFQFLGALRSKPPAKLQLSSTVATVGSELSNIPGRFLSNSEWFVFTEFCLLIYSRLLIFADT